VRKPLITVVVILLAILTNMQYSASRILDSISSTSNRLRIDWKSSFSGELGPALMISDKYLFEVIFDNADFFDQKFTIVNINMNEGKTNWTRDGYLNTIYVNKDRLLASGNEELVCLDQNNGTLKWRNELIKGGYIYYFHPYHESTILRMENGSMYLPDNNTGNVIWQNKNPNSSNSSNNSLIITSINVYETVYNYSTKSFQLHTLDMNTGSKILIPNIDLPFYYLNNDDTDAYFFDFKSKTIIKFNLENYSTVWKSNITYDIKKVYIQGDRLFIHNQSIVSCLKATSGQIIWEKNIEDRIVSNTVFSGDKAYLVASSKGELVLITFDATNGDIIWTNVIGKSLNESLDWTKLAISSGRVIASVTSGYLSCYNKAYDILVFKIGSKELKADNEIKLMDVSPQIIDFRTYLPARYLVEAFGGSVDWDKEKSSISVSFFNKEIEMTVNKSIAIVNDEEVQIDPNNPKITPIILNGRTMVPVRFLAESLGCEVKWDAKTKTITIRYQP